MNSLQLYHQMLDLSRAMELAAQGCDWTEVLSLEQQIARTRDQLIARIPIEGTLPAPIRIQERKMAEESLQAQQCALEHMRAWMADIEPWMRLVASREGVPP